MLLKCLVFVIRSAMFVVIAWHSLMPELGTKAPQSAQNPDQTGELDRPQA